MMTSVRRAGPADAAGMLALIQEAFSGRPALHPPADALVETESGLAARLVGDRGVVCEHDGTMVACLVMDPAPEGETRRR
jgi:tRNA threonylcarbamoyladenosine biosynthesis protein TsaE